MRAGVLSNARWCALCIRTKLGWFLCHEEAKWSDYVTVFYILCVLHRGSRNKHDVRPRNGILFRESEFLKPVHCRSPCLVGVTMASRMDVFYNLSHLSHLSHRLRKNNQDCNESRWRHTGDYSELPLPPIQNSPGEPYSGSQSHTTRRGWASCSLWYAPVANVCD